MKKVLVVTTSILGLMAVQGSASRADEELDRIAKDPKQWVMQTGDYANTRLFEAQSDQRTTMSASCRWPGPSRPACCADMKAGRW